MLHDVLALLDALRVLPYGNLLRGALEPEEVLDVQLGGLLEAGPVGVLGMHAVDAVLVYLDAILEALVPGLDVEGAGAEVLGVALAEEEVFDAHDLLEEVGHLHAQLGAAVHHVDGAVRANLLFCNKKKGNVTKKINL